MTLLLPSWLPAELVALVAGHFPECDEDALRRCGDSLAETARDLLAISLRYGTVAGLAHTTLTGMTRDSMVQQDRRVHAAACDTAAYADSMARQCHEGATAMEFNKLLIKYTLYALALQLTADALMFGVGVLKAAYDRQVARTAVAVGRTQVLTRLETSGAAHAAVRSTMSPLTQVVLMGGGLGALFGGSVNALAQYEQVRDGYRDHIDGDSVVESVVTGIAGGIAGVAVTLRVAPRVSRVVERLSHRAKHDFGRYGAHVVGVLLLGAAGGVGGGVGGVAMSVPFHGLPDLAALEAALITGFGGGFVGSAATGMRAAHNAQIEFTHSPDTPPGYLRNEAFNYVHNSLRDSTWLTPADTGAAEIAFARGYDLVHAATAHHGSPRVDVTTTTRANGGREIRVTITEAPQRHHVAAEAPAHVTAPEAAGAPSFATKRSIEITLDEADPRHISVVADPVTVAKYERGPVDLRDGALLEALERREFNLDRPEEKVASIDPAEDHRIPRPLGDQFISLPSEHLHGPYEDAPMPQMSVIASHDLNGDHITGVEKVYVVVHGVLRNVDEYYRDFVDSLGDRFDPATTAIVAVKFPSPVDIDHALTQLDDPAQRTVIESLPRWGTDEWRGGEPAAGDGPPISSYEAMDDVLAHLTYMMPDLKTVEFRGNSEGRQYLERYAMFGRGPTALEHGQYTVYNRPSNGGTVLYLRPERPIFDLTDPNWAERYKRERIRFAPIPRDDPSNQWPFGMENPPPYVRRELARYSDDPDLAVKIAAMNYLRRVEPFVGFRDNNPEGSQLPIGPAANQGPNRELRSVAHFWHLMDIAEELVRDHGIDVPQRRLVIGDTTHDHQEVFAAFDAIESFRKVLRDLPEFDR